MSGEQKSIIAFVLLTFALSSIFWVLLSGSHQPQTEHRLIVALMWCPGLSALIVSLITRKTVRDFGWKFAGWRYELAGLLIPILYCICAYVPVWISGIGGLPNPHFHEVVQAKFPQLSLRLATVADFLWIGSVSMLPSAFAALGEEIGWRGYLVPQMAKFFSRSRVAVISGLIWALWHFEPIMFAGYNNGTPVWYALIMFTIMVTAFSFILTWFRLKSGSIWPCVLLHASHNNFIELFFTPATVEKEWTKYFIDEFGIATVISISVVALVLWRSKRLNGAAQPVSQA